MKTIYKYPLHGFTPILARRNIKIEVPQGAKFVAVIEQNAIPCIYAEVDDTQPKQERKFLIIGTGHPIDNPLATYIGTCVIDWYVAHVYVEAR